MQLAIYLILFSTQCQVLMHPLLFANKQRFGEHMWGAT